MNVDEALRQLGRAEGVPREAIAWAVANWETAAPRFIARLRTFASGGDRSEAADCQAFHIAHLSGQMREARAYEPLCRMIADDPDLDIWLGDAVADTLPGILVNTFDGDASPLLAAIESTGEAEHGRGSALLALGYLARSKGVLDDSAMRDLLRRLRREAQPRDLSSFWFCWAETAAALGLTDLKMEVALLAKDGFIEAVDFRIADFERIAALAHGDPAGLAGFHDLDVRPLDDAAGALEALAFGGDDGDEREAAVRTDSEPDEPHVNPWRNVGRNDPCPCGSGKKYKKCCLAA